MAQINKANEYFNTKLYTGNGSTQSITGVNFQPDWVWLKQRSGGSNHRCYDIVRGATKQIYPNLTNAEVTEANGLTSFDSDGFTLGNEGGHNQNGQTFASWNWLAGGTASSNTDGSITSSISASTTAGFSVVSFTSNNTSGATIGHGLGVAPSMVIIKRRSSSEDWGVGHQSLGWTKFIRLNTDGAEGTSTGLWNDTAPSSTVVTLGNSGISNPTSGTTMIAYCFAEKKGFSKFGSYVGNGNADGTFIYTGFKPAFVMMKNASASATPWFIFDAKRNPSNETDLKLNPNSSDAESSANPIDILSNGFKLRTSGSYNNGSGNTLIYMCFAESPIVGTNGVPATAR